MLNLSVVSRLRRETIRRLSLRQNFDVGSGSAFKRSVCGLVPAFLVAAFLVVIGTVSVHAIDTESAATPHNVLFIAVDDMKPLLDCYGDKTAIAPAMERIASGGTIFSNAQCQWPVCGPSRASLMTSLRPEATGVMNLKTSMREKNPDVLTLPQHFKQHGYATAGAGKIYDPRCVDDKKTLDEPSWSIPFVRPKSKSKADSGKRFALAPDVADDELIDGKIAQDGIKLMRKLGKSDKPFFLAVGFKKPHLPFVAPKKYWDLYQRDQFPLAEHPGGIANDSGYSLHDGTELRGYDGIPESGDIPDDLQREAIHGYYACVSYVDTQIGLLLDELDALGLAENTTIVLWGDHGFHLGDHGMWGKHSTLEQAAHVPFLIKPAGGSATARPSTTSPVELTDIFPTLCEITKVDLPDGLSGRSLMPLIRGEEDHVRDGAITVFKSRGSIGYSYRTEQYRYTEWINKSNKVAATELYDYEKDPLETKNLIDDPDYSRIIKRLSRQLREDGQDCERLQATVSGTMKKVSAPIERKKKKKGKVASEDLPLPTGPRLREIAPLDGPIPLLIGGTISSTVLGTSAETILNREFQFVTPANAFKQAAIHPEPDKWRWKKADAWVDRCEERGEIMRLHACMSPQCSAWAEEDHRTPEELSEVMEEYLTAVCQRYGKRKPVRWMDVVNETITREGEWFGPREGVGKWQNPWPQIGYDETHPLRPPLYIKRAFEIANQHAPNVKLLYNQHGDMEVEAWKKVCATVMYLREKGVRVDGIGWQAHIDSGFENEDGNITRLNQLIDWAHRNDLEFHVTENTVWMNDGKSDEDYAAQAKTFGAIVETLLAHSENGVVTWNAWQMRDSDTQRAERRGNLFDGDGKPKPSYYAVQEALMNHGK